MTESIADLLARLRKVCAEATPGPWRYDYFTEVVHGPDGESVLEGEKVHHSDADGYFAATARAVLPAALDCVAALERMKSTRCECDLVPDECDICAALAAFRKAGEER